MKILLVALNAKYIHSNLAVYSLRAFAHKYAENIKIIELTINHSEEEILKSIYKEKADVIAFSCYIWNIDIIKRITTELNKVLPKAEIWYGGPEVSYDAKNYLRTMPELKGVIVGEGEQTFLELAGYYIDQNMKLTEINGITYKELENSERQCESSGKVDEQDMENKFIQEKIITTPDRQPLELDSIPFPYEKFDDFEHRIIYYESSRGCPFSCSYCLSSIDKKVRLRSTDLVKRELKIFLDQNIPQVKFVDRTFNCNKNHAMEIWRFIKENDNGITNFHFEISADLLTAEEIEFLATLRPGQIQFEVGVQSTNPNTVNAISRRADFEKISKNVKRIKEGNNIHQHLDLIAGLPLEDFQAFERSFGEVYNLKPDQLQLGFLKVLKGSSMEIDSKTYGIVYQSKAPYEVLCTSSLSYDEILRIKGICEMVEIYYNSAQFTYSMGFLEHYYTSPIKLYEDLYDYYEETGLSSLSHNRMRRYEILLNFYKEIVMPGLPEEEKRDRIPLFTELLVYDLYLREDLKARPHFAPTNQLSVSLHEISKKYGMERRNTHIEQFRYDVYASASTGKTIKKDMILMFDYKNRDPLNRAAGVTVLQL